jgi:hypothetical protein
VSVAAGVSAGSEQSQEQRMRSAFWLDDVPAFLPGE